MNMMICWHFTGDAHGRHVCKDIYVQREMGILADCTTIIGHDGHGHLS